MFIQESFVVAGRGRQFYASLLQSTRILQQLKQRSQQQRWIAVSINRPKTYPEDLADLRKQIQKDGSVSGTRSAFAPMPDVENMDWTRIWDTASTYNPFLIPLPVRCGRAREKKPGIGPTAPGNIELMKIPNFFHLTPIAIEKHCKALKPYITPWPEKVARSIRITTINYIFAGPSIRHPDSRFVKLQVKLADLKLDKRAERKFVLLVGDRYNRATGDVTLSTGQCPTRTQNKEYAYYLLGTLYEQANKTESWEEEAANYTEEFIDAEVAKVRETIDPMRHKKPKKKKLPIIHHRILGKNMVRFNSEGHPFILWTGDDIKPKDRLVSQKQLKKAKLVWQSIKKDEEKDTSTFDPPYKSSYRSEFDYS